MTGWIEFAVAMGLFLISHRLPAMLGVKGWLQAWLGPSGYTVLFSLASLAILYWAILAAAGRPSFPCGTSRTGTVGR